MRIASMVHATFAVTMISLGTVGLFRPDFAPVWNPVPATVPARELFLYLGALISLTCGIGLLVQRVAIMAARLLLATLLLWLLLFRLPKFLHAPAFEACWSVFPLAVMLAAAWVLYVWFATDWDRRRLGFAAGEGGMRIARALYGLALIPIGLAHFLYLQNTVSLVPGWLPWHTFWAYFTGLALMVAGAAVLLDVYARLAAALSAIEIGLFLLLVWVPIVAAGAKNAFQWSETIVSTALTAGAWVVADSYRGMTPSSIFGSRRRV